MKKHLVDRRKSLALFLVVFVLYSLIYMTKNCYSAAMASIVNENIMTKTETGLIAAAFYLVYAPFQIVGGFAADKFSPYKLILIGMAGAGVCNMLVYFLHDNYIAMLVIWSLNAAIQFGIWPSVFKITVAELAPEHRTRGVYFMMMTPTVGLAASYVTAAFIDKWQNNFLFSGVVLFSLVLIFFFFYRGVSRSMVADANPTDKGKKTVQTKSGKELLLLIVKSGIPLLLIVYTVQGIMNIGLKSLVPVMLLESYESVTPEIANMLNIIIIVLTPIGMFIGGLPFFKRFSYPGTIAILFGVSVPLAFLLTFIGSANIVVIIAALTVIVCAMSAMSAYFSYCSKTFEKFGMGGALSGIFNCMSALGMVLSNYVFMGIAEDYGWGVTTKVWFSVVIGAFILAAVSVGIWKRFCEKHINND